LTILPSFNDNISIAGVTYPEIPSENDKKKLTYTNLKGIGRSLFEGTITVEVPHFSVLSSLLLFPQHTIVKLIYPQHMFFPYSYTQYCLLTEEDCIF
jgi:hypothetical protein